MQKRQIDEIVAWLATFKSEADIAAECRKRGIQGDPQWSNDCLVANIVLDEFGVAGVDVLPDEDGGYIELGDCIRRLPPAANALALAFDAGVYGEMEYRYDDEDEEDTDLWEEEHGEPVGVVE